MRFITRLHWPAFALLVAISATFGCSGSTPDKPLPPEAARTPEPPAEETEPAGDADGPNIVLIVLDALRADRVEAERDGTPVMPRLRAFAETSRYFTRAYAQSTWTKPSMASLFTSTYPDVHNVLFGTPMNLVEGQRTTADRLPEECETLAETLQAAGYRTIGVQTNGNMTRALGMAQGFDVYLERAYPAWRAKDVTDQALEQIAAGDGPFLLFLHYMDPHGPYDPPETHRAAFADFPAAPEDDLAVMEDYAFWYNDQVLHDVGLKAERETPDFSPEGEAYVRALYDGDCRYADAEVGRLLDAVYARHPDTVTVVLADHGEELWDHGSIGHGKTVYEELTRVPLVLHVPGVAPERIDSPVELVDVLPTLASVAGIAPRPGWQGRDLLAHDGQDPERAVFTRTWSSLRETGIDLAAVVQDATKLVYDHAAQAYALYDLAADPLERAPLEDALRLRRLAALLEAHDAANAEHPERRQPQQAELDEEALRDLEAQGYGGVRRP